MIGDGNVDQLGLQEEAERRENLPVCDDINEYFLLLRSTNEYQNTLKGRSRNAMEAWGTLGKPTGEPKPTPEEVESAYEEIEEFKQLFWDFNQEVVHLGFNPDHYAEKFRREFSDYQTAVAVSLRAAQGSDVDEIRAKDLVRSEFHNKAAAALLEEPGIGGYSIKTEFVARMAIRAFLVDIGKDYIPSARQADALRHYRSLPEGARSKFLSDVISIRWKPAFTPERAHQIQDEYLHSHSGVGYIARKKCMEKPDFPQSGQGLSPQGDQENMRISLR